MLLRENVKVGNYVVKRLLKRGGTSLVWLAVDRYTDNIVVLKEPRIDNDPYQGLMNIKFVRHESSVLKIVNHDNVVRRIEGLRILRPIRIGGEVEYPTVLVLEYIEGTSLKELRKKSPLYYEDILEIMHQLCIAVSYLHDMGIVHRDLKPSNILVDTDSLELRCKIIDFGTSSIHGKMVKDRIRSPGGYTAPEQVTMGLHLPQSDIWSLGAILFFLVTGRDPIIDLKGYPHPERPPDPAKYTRKIDKNIRRVIMRAMKPAVIERYQSAEEMLMDLEK
ncbi:MAG: serine/threonine protein kinase [Crenarchaeota archaeon]|nr:serine/threonine protein kinase [Thermoproteota archaeon]